MHYDGTLRGRFQDPIIVEKITGKAIEVNREMSPLDIQKLNALYPCKPSDPIRSVNTCSINLIRSGIPNTTFGL